MKLTWWVVFGVAVGDARGKRDLGDMQDVGVIFDLKGLDLEPLGF